MTIFKTFVKVLFAYKLPIIMYTGFLILFAIFNFQTSDTNIAFESTKPRVAIVCEDEEIGLTKHLINYISESSTIKDISNENNAIEDALFYRDINYVIYIPKEYRNKVLSGEVPEIQIKTTGNYDAAVAHFQLERYMKALTLYVKNIQDGIIGETDLMNIMDDTLEKTAEVELTSKIDSDFSNTTFYYNFMNYSLLAGCVYVICLVLSSFNDKKIQARTIISSTNYKAYNRKLLLSSSIFAISLWGVYILLSFVLLRDNMFCIHGVFYIINSFVFMMCALSLAFLIHNMVFSKNAINGIVNVIALGSSFLCGAFVPMEWLPDTVLTIAHIFPSYYYIYNNELLAKVDNFTLDALQPILLNIAIMFIFIILINIFTIVFAKRRRRT